MKYENACSKELHIISVGLLLLYCFGDTITKLFLFTNNDNHIYGSCQHKESCRMAKKLLTSLLYTIITCRDASLSNSCGQHGTCQKNNACTELRALQKETLNATWNESLFDSMVANFATQKMLEIQQLMR
jgi:hypothetical protein